MQTTGENNFEKNFWSRCIHLRLKNPAMGPRTREVVLYHAWKANFKPDLDLHLKLTNHLFE